MKPGSNKARKEASKRLGLKLMQDYRALVEASGTDDIQAAAIELGNTFNTNVEFIINVLKAYGGMDVKFEPLTTRARTLPANDLPDIAALTSTFEQDDTLKFLTKCTCPPMEPGIIGYKHMASCPHFEG